MRLFLSISFIFLACGLLSAQKEYKTLRTYIKNGGNLAQTITTVQKLEKDEDFKDDPELYYLAALCERKANETDNTKVYLKQAYDTVSFFNTTYGMFDYIIKCDVKDQLPDKNGKVKLKYRTKGYDMLKNYYPNLYNAGIFFTRKKDWKNAAKFWEMYLDAVKTPVFEKDTQIKNNSKMPRAAFWYMSCCYELKDYKNVFKYTDIAAEDTANTDLFLQYKAVSYAQLKDTVNYEKELIKGMKEEPDDLFFFTNLTDYYNSSKQYGKALAMVDSLLKENPKANMVTFAKSVILYNMKNYDDCITLAEQVIKTDSTNADAYFYMGSCYYNKAVEIDDNISPNINAKSFSANKKKSKDLFSKAMPYLEKYKQMKPTEKDRWAPLLYRTYLALNLGKKFSEMDAILTQPAQDAKK